MKSLRTVGLCVGLVACVALMGCSGSDSDQGKVKTATNTEAATKQSIANNPHLSAQTKAAALAAMDRAKAAGMGGPRMTR